MNGHINYKLELLRMFFFSILFMSPYLEKKYMNLVLSFRVENFSDII